MIDRKKAELDTRRPLTEEEVERLTEEFVVEYTYNSNAIEGNMLTLRETDLVLRGLTIDQKQNRQKEWNSGSNRLEREKINIGNLSGRTMIPL